MKLFIFGASEFAREIAQLAQQCGHEVSGFINDDPAIQTSDIEGIPVQPWVDALARRTDEQFVIALGSPQARTEICQRLAQYGLPVATLIHPKAQIDQAVEIGAGSIIADGCIVGAATTVGRCVIISVHTTVGRGDIIEDFVSIMPGVKIGNAVHIKRGVYIGPHATIRNRTFQRPIVIGENAAIGMGAVVFQAVSADVIIVSNSAHVC